jgi:predicted transcriptional regulator
MSSLLTVKDKESVEKFIQAYNTIDKHMRIVLGEIGTNPKPGYKNILKHFCKNRAYRRYEYELTLFGDLRNVLVHGNTNAYPTIAIPTTAIIQRIEEIQKQLTEPEQVYSRFGKSVEKVEAQQTLASVFHLIKKRDYSQFPVYRSNDFIGMLTENGITRWLANHVSTNFSLIELEDNFVESVLAMEEQRDNYIFIPRNMALDVLIAEFSESKTLLEAALITHSGKPTEELLGIVTRWDILGAIEPGV